MTREETLKVIEAFFENPLLTDQYKAAFNIAMHDIKACNNAKTHLNSIYGTMVTDSIYCDTDSIKIMEKNND